MPVNTASSRNNSKVTQVVFLMLQVQANGHTELQVNCSVS